MRYWKGINIQNREKIRIVAASYLNNNKKRYTSCKSFIYSILSQTYENFELFIVHDGPIDECKEKEELLKIVNSDNRIKLFETSERLGKFGYPHRKKYAFIDENFDWLIYTNDDNYYIPVAIESMLNTVQQNDRSVVFTNMISSHKLWEYFDTSFARSFVDLGCLMFKKDLIKSFDFDLTDDCFEADGKLVENIKETIDSKHIIKINNFLFIHN